MNAIQVSRITHKNSTILIYNILNLLNALSSQIRVQMEQPALTESIDTHANVFLVSLALTVK